MGAQFINYVSLSPPASLHRPPERSIHRPPTSMLCGNVGWVAGLLCACAVMLGPMGQPVNNREVGEVLRGDNMTTPARNNWNESTFAAKHDVRQSFLLSAAEQEFVLKRKQIAMKSLNNLGITLTLDSVPHIALLGSGGGQRSALSLVGSLYQMEKEGLLDTVLYLGGVSGSAWSMSSLYRDPQWSANMDRVVSNLSGPEVPLEQALAWLGERAKEEHFSLTDIWGVVTSVGIMKQLDPRHLSEDSMTAFNPYPVYNAVDKNCLQNGPEKGKWFEMTPREVGFTDLGLFINTSRLGSRNYEADPEVQEMDMVKLQGIMGSAVANEQSLFNFMPVWLKGLVGAATDENNLLDVAFLWTEVPNQVKKFWDVSDRYMRGYHSLLKVTELIRKNTEDPTVLSGLDDLQKTLKESLNLNPMASFEKKSPKQQQKLILEQWGQKMAPIHTWIQSLEEGPVKSGVSLLIQKVFPLIQKWEWGTTENFLYQYPGAAVPACLRLKEHIELIDAGLMLNMPYPPFLGEKRDVDLLIALESGADDIFKTLILARDYAAEVKKPFPEIDPKILEERDWPNDCYVFEGKEKEPTIIYMPLFNRRNCKDAEEFKAKMEEFSTFQRPFSQEKTEFVLETAKFNIKNNKETLLREINKAALRRHNKSYGSWAESGF
ncbi:cytosolic phospholipase A2 zeta-like [Dicentrarchus labrax]|uniref:PLA2c domain-containing protein n=1 Tax=Dicentrarchus labrax TaxID=13489 RepID=A0A8C4IRI1_DICLA|nr:cytosolic phospholipase A2 zeta-like [Dicentrarchus labrax]